MISRTAPTYAGRDAVHEIEALYLAVIAAAHRSVSIESQYSASRKLAKAIAARRTEPDAPEFVFVNPESADGWLEEEVMGSSRARLMSMVQDVDRHGRCRIYRPVAQEGTPIYVHAKIVVMDDRLLRVGSSNLNNRSLGLDTECDLTVEARPNDPEDAELRQRITGLRHNLLTEHLDVSLADVEGVIAQTSGSLIKAIETLRGSGRSLVPSETPHLSMAEEVLGESDLLDPERPAGVWRPFNPLRLPSWGAE